MLPDTLYFYSVGKLHWGLGINHAATVFFYSFGNYAAAYWEFFCFYWSVHIARGPSKEKFTMTTARVYSCKGTKQKM
jgi:hypothetical protein